MMHEMKQLSSNARITEMMILIEKGHYSDFHKNACRSPSIQLYKDLKEAELKYGAKGADALAERLRNDPTEQLLI